MNPISVSVVMPVYNTAPYLAAAVESILNQTVRDFEYILIDDGSTDGSLRILQRYAEKDPRIRLIHRGNRGLVRTRNELLHEARAELVAWADSDDVSYPHRLETQLRCFSERPGLMWCQAAVRMVDPDGYPIRVFDHADTPGFTCVAMMRREPAMVLGGFREALRMCEDRDLALRLAEVGELAFLPDVLVDYRQHSRSVCHANSQILKAYGNLVDQLAQERRERGSDCLQRGEPLPHELPEALHRPGPEWRTHACWAWWALEAGNRHTARKHAWRAVMLAPWSAGNWRVLYCALRGR